MPQPARILADIDRNGAQNALGALDAQPATFEHALDAIETADPAWLAVARRLRPAADGGFAEGLDMAMARALPNDPVRVLGLVDQGIPLATLCTSPFIEPEPGVAEAYATRTLTALATVRQPQLRDRATRCAARVRRPFARSGNATAR